MDAREFKREQDKQRRARMAKAFDNIRQICFKWDPSFSNSKMEQCDILEKIIALCRQRHQSDALLYHTLVQLDPSLPLTPATITATAAMVISRLQERRVKADAIIVSTSSGSSSSSTARKSCNVSSMTASTNDLSSASTTSSSILSASTSSSNTSAASTSSSGTSLLPTSSNGTSAASTSCNETSPTSAISNDDTASSQEQTPPRAVKRRASDAETNQNVKKPCPSVFRSITNLL